MAILNEEDSIKFIDSWFKYITEDIDDIIDPEDVSTEKDMWVIIEDLMIRRGSPYVSSPDNVPMSECYFEMKKKYNDHRIAVDIGAYHKYNTDYKILRLLKAYAL